MGEPISERHGLIPASGADMALAAVPGREAEETADNQAARVAKLAKAAPLKGAAP